MKSVEKITLTKKEKKEIPEILLKIYDITNYMMDQKLSMTEVTLSNGWKVKLQNNRFGKQIGVPTK